MFVETKEAGEQQAEQKVGALKLSEAIRQRGYGNHMNYDDCVLGRAYNLLTGRKLTEDGYKHPDGKFLNHKTGHMVNLIFCACAADAFGIPRDTALQAEQMCYHRRHTSDQIADWLQGIGY